MSANKLPRSYSAHHPNARAIFEAWIAGATMAKVCEQYNCCPKTVRRIAARFELPGRPEGYNSPSARAAWKDACQVAILTRILSW